MTTVELGRFRALDHEFEVVADREAADVLRRALGKLAIPAPSGRAVERVEIVEIIETVDDGGGLSIVVDGVTAGRAGSRARLLALLLEHVNRRAAASVAAVVPFHAAAVSHRSGGTVLLAGRSGSGKSTLAAAAIVAGWSFVAEEIAAVDPAGRVRAFPRPIGLRRGGAHAIGIEYPDDEWYSEVFPWVPPSDAHRSAGQIAGIVVVERSPTADPRGLQPAQALAELVEHVVVPDDRELVAVFRRLEHFVRTVPVVVLGQDEPDRAVAALGDLVDRWAS